MIDKLRNILHKIEKYPSIKEDSFLRFREIKYKVSSTDINYINFFIKNFNKLSEKDKDKVIKKKKSDLFKIYRIKKNNKSYIGSTSTSIFFFFRFNLYLLLTNQPSVFDYIGVKEPLNTSIEVLEIVKPIEGTRKLVQDRKNFIKDPKEYSEVDTDEHKKITLIDTYMSLYNKEICKPIGIKETRYIYLAEQNKLSFIFMTKKKIQLKNIKNKLPKKFNLNKEISLKLIDKTSIRNSLEESIIKDRYKILYKPTLNTKFELVELETVDLSDISSIQFLKKIIFIRVNKLLLKERLKNKLKTNNFVYMLKNKINGSGGIKYYKNSLEDLIDGIYDKAIKGNKNLLSKDLELYPEKDFELRILRVLKETDNPLIVENRFSQKYPLKGYTFNIKQIYSIINSKKNKI